MTGAAVREPAVQGPERAGVRWTPVAALAAGTFAVGTDLFVVAGVLAGLAGDLGTSLGSAGAVVAVSGLAAAVGGPVLGAALGGRPQRPVLLGSLAVVGLAAAGSAAAPSFAVLLGARALGALAGSVYVPAAGAAAVAAVPADARGRALGGVLLGTSAAMVLGAPLGVLLAAASSWRAAFALVGVLAAAAVAVLLASGVGTGRLTRSTLAERLGPVRRPAVVAALGVTFLVMTASNSVYSYLGVLAGSAGPGLLMAAFGLGGTAGAWLGGTAADHGDQRVVLLAGLGLAASVAVLPPAAPTAVALLAVVAGWGTSVWAFTAAQQRRLLGLGPGPAALLLALNSATTHLGFAAGALLGGLVVGTGAGPLSVLAVACCGAGLTLHLVSDREVRP
jgi:predicted MFS family arabinose efflux permease